MKDARTRQISYLPPVIQLEKFNSFHWIICHHITRKRLMIIRIKRAKTKLFKNIRLKLKNRLRLKNRKSMMLKKGKMKL
jgi:hypothetical protein